MKIYCATLDDAVRAGDATGYLYSIRHRHIADDYIVSWPVPVDEAYRDPSGDGPGGSYDAP